MRSRIILLYNAYTYIYKPYNRRSCTLVCAFRNDLLLAYNAFLRYIYIYIPTFYNNNNNNNNNNNIFLRLIVIYTHARARARYDIMR